MGKSAIVRNLFLALLLAVISSGTAWVSPLRGQGVTPGSGAGPAPGANGAAVPPAAEEKGEAWAVIIGVNSYLDPQLPTLKYAVADARRMYETLTKQCGYSSERVLLFDSEQRDIHRQPSRFNLRERIREWMGWPKKQDTVLIYFSGHGMVDGEGRGYLAPQDCELNRLNDTALRTEELRDMLQTCTATQKVLLLDCCHAGAGKAAGAVGPPAGLLGRQFEATRGLVTLASCMQNEFSMEWDTKKQGLFTYYLALGLAGEADLNKDGVVDFDELHNFTLDRVQRTAALELYGQQHPVRIIPSGTVGVFRLARLTAPRVVIPAPAPVSPVTPVPPSSAPPARSRVPAIRVRVLAPDPDLRSSTNGVLFRFVADALDDNHILDARILINNDSTARATRRPHRDDVDEPRKLSEQWRVPLKPGWNSIIVEVRNEVGSVRSDPIRVYYDARPQEVPRPAPPLSSATYAYLPVELDPSPSVRGVRVLRVVGNSGTAGAGERFYPGDVILTVDHRPVRNVADIDAALALQKHIPGDLVWIEVVRRGARVVVQPRLLARPR
jgi:hypothetical protein